MKSVSGARQVYLFLVSLALLLFCGFQQQPAKPLLVSFGIGLGEQAFAKPEWSFEQRSGELFRKELAKGGQYRIIPFSRTHPSIQRALAERTLPSELLLPPFTGMAGEEFKVVKIARVMRADFAVSGTADRLTVAGDGKKAAAVVTFELYDVANGKLVGTHGATYEASGENEADAIANLIAVICTKGAEDSRKLLDEYRAKASGGG